MNKLWKRIASLTLALCMVAGLASCSSSSSGDVDISADIGGTTSSTTSSSSSSSDSTEAPATTTDGATMLYSNGGPEEFFETPWLNPGSFTYNKVLYAHLLVGDESLNPVAGHADALADYSVSDDGMVITFTLRDDAYWHDGEQITPEDIKWSIEYVSKTAVCNAVFSSTFKAIEGATDADGNFNETFSGIVIDGQDIIITFDAVAPDALLTFTQFSPVPAKYFEGVDPLLVQQAAYFQSPVGSGPFMVDEVNMNNYTTLKAFDQYYNGVADFSIYLLPSAGDSDDNFVTRALSGQLDYGYTKSVADVLALEGAEGITVTAVDVRYTRMFYVNKFADADGNESPLADERVRQAMAYAIDMNAICLGLMDGTALPANSMIPSDLDKATGLEDYDYNPDAAMALLAEAGWDSSTVLDVVYYYTDQATVDMMTAIQAYLAAVGINMEFRLVEGDLATLLWSAPADQTNGPSAVDWDMCYAAVSALSLHEYYDRFRTGSSSNSHTPEDPELNALIDATNASPDADVQMAAFKELSAYENENLFCIPLYYQPVFMVTSDKVNDFPVANPQFNYYWDIQNWALNY